KRCVASRTAAINATSEELCAFVTSLSNDLQVRLRPLVDVHIRAASECAHSGSALEAILRDVENSAAYARAALSDLSELASIGARVPRHERVDMNELVRDTLSRLSHMIKGREIEVDTTRLPAVHADEQLLQ